MHLLLYHILLATLSLLAIFPTASANDHPAITDTNLKPTSSAMGMLNEQDYEPAPPTLNLEQVHVYVRHGMRLSHCSAIMLIIYWVVTGERTPVGIRMSEAPGNIPAFWNLCKSARQFKAAVVGANNASDSIEILRLSERADGYAKEGEW
jgi:hypothetical protein